MDLDYMESPSVTRACAYCEREVIRLTFGLCDECNAEESADAERTAPVNPAPLMNEKEH